MSGSAGQSRYSSPRYTWYVVVVLLLVYMMHHLDRMIVTLLLDPIGREFRLSDSQLGLLAGLAYAVPFAIAGLPLGMLVDRVNRVRMVGTLLTIWSGLTALSAFATGFWTLLIARVGVAAAESGGTPTNVSLISDAVPAKRRATALGVYYTGSSLGTIFGFAVAGAVAAEYGWRAGFLVAGLPGLLLAILVWRTVVEPQRGHHHAGRDAADQSRTEPAPSTAPSLGEALRMIIATKPALHLIAGSTIAGMVAIGLSTWLPALMIRSHGADLASVGTLIAFAISPLGAVATLIGGRVGDRLHARSAAMTPVFLGSCVAVTMPAAGFAILSPTMTGLVVGFALQTVAQVLISAPAYAAVMGHVPANVRGVTASVMQVSANVLGFGIGAQVIGIGSDLLHPIAGDQSLRYAMLALLAVNFWAVLHFVLATRAARRQEARA